MITRWREGSGRAKWGVDLEICLRPDSNKSPHGHQYPNAVWPGCGNGTDMMLIHKHIFPNSCFRQGQGPLFRYVIHVVPSPKLLLSSITAHCVSFTLPPFPRCSAATPLHSNLHPHPQKTTLLNALHLPIHYSAPLIHWRALMRGCVLQPARRWPSWKEPVQSSSLTCGRRYTAS